jgi:hypothetical protein
VTTFGGERQILAKDGTVLLHAAIFIEAADE